MGKFLKKVRHGEIDGPRKCTFTPDSWKAAFEQHSSGDEEDVLLFNSGLRIHTKLAAIRGVLSKSQLRKLSTVTLGKVLVATANHQYEALFHQVRQANAAIANNKQLMDVDFLTIASTQVQLVSGESFAIDAALTSLLDGIRLPLKVALQGRRKAGLESLSDAPWNDINLEMNLGIFYEQFEGLWEDCVWSTYAIVGKERQVIALPINPEAKRGMHASQLRKVALGIEATIYAKHAFERAKALGVRGKLKEVQSVEIDGDNQTIVLGPSAKDPHSQAFLHANFLTACPEFLDSLLGEPRERLAGLSITQLFDGWMVIANAAAALWQKSSPLLQSPQTTLKKEYSDMHDYIPFLDKHVLANAIHEAAGVHRAGAAAIVDFLTFDGTNSQDFFTQPLVKVDDSSKLYFVAGAIVTPPNMRYVAEKWMAQLGVELESRGQAFELHIRNVLFEAISTSPLLSEAAKVVPEDYTFRCVDERFAQMDSLFCVGSSVFVVEVKCILEPVDASSTGTHRVALEHAAVQAKFRVSLIEEFREHFIREMKRFGWKLPADFRIYPLIAVSTWAHVGVAVDSVPVVDELVFERFFEGKYNRVGLQADTLTVAERIEKMLYESAEEAEFTAARYFDAPPQLKQYSENLKLREFPLYPVSDGDWYGTMVDYDQISAGE